jgi:hypothetical protein
MQLNTHEEFIQSTTTLFENHPPATLCRNLRTLLIRYLQYELAKGYPKKVNEYLPELVALFHWLDIADAAMNKEYDQEKLLFFTARFLDDHSPTDLHNHLLRLQAGYLQHILAEGYPQYLVNILPSFTAFLEWLDSTSKLINENSFTLQIA